MSFRYHRSIKLLPGLHLNVGKSGIGISAGRRGFHVGVDSRKRPYVSAGIPGTGMSWREYPKAPAARPASPRPASRAWIVILFLLVLIGLLSIKPQP